MGRTLLIKIAVVGVVIIASLVLSMPPGEKISLGLDLRGGLHLVLEVQVDKAVEQSLERTADTVRKDLLAAGVPIVAVEPYDLQGIRLLFREPPERAAVNDAVLNALPFSQAVEQSPDVWLYEIPADELNLIRTDAVNQALEKIRNRVDAFGVSEPSISRQGAHRIVIQLPGLEDAQRAIDLIGRTAQLEFKLVQSLATDPNAAAPPGSEILYEKIKDPQTQQMIRGQPYVVERRAALTGNMLSDARALPDQYQFGQYYVQMRLNSRGKRLFARLTQENVGRALAIVLDDTIFSAPVIQEPILGGEAQITGTFTPEEARDLAIVLREGALPAPVSIIENRTVGPSLGSDSISRGVRSTILGGVLVILFMMAYYRMSGLVADLALGLNLLILMGVLALPGLGATLTLPGIAGVLLTLGMAIDANVLIFERIREEMRLGKSVRGAVDAGFGRAFTAILDANVTTLIGAVVLFQFGSGPIKGFAVTLSIGLSASMFTAVFVSRTIFETVFSLRQVQKLSV